MTIEPDPRIDKLEAELHRLDSEVQQLRAQIEVSSPAAAPGDRLVPVPPPWQTPTVTAIPPPRPRQLPVLESEIALKWAGVGLVVLAVGFALSTAIRRGWIGPELQLLGAVGLSLGLIAAGLHLQPTRPRWTHALCSGGVAALFTTFASNLFLEQASDNVAFICTVVAGLFGYTLAWLTSSEWVGGVSLAGGAIGWLVIGDGDAPFAATWAWFVVLVGVALVLSLVLRWFALRFVAHGVGLLAILGLAGEFETSTHQILTLAGAALLCGSLAWVPSIGDLRTIWQQFEVQLAIVAGPWLVGVSVLSLDLDDDIAIGTLALGVSAMFALAAVGLRPWLKPAHFVSMLIGASVSLSIGLATMLSTSAAFVAMAVQGVGLVIFSRALAGNVRTLINAAILLCIAGLWATGTTLDAWDYNASVGDDIAHLAVIAALGAAVWQSRIVAIRGPSAVSILGLVLAWLGSVLVHLPEGQAAVSVSWAIVGATLLVVGALRKIPELGVAGLAVIGLTVAKLITVDLQEVDTLWRAALFFGVGVAIMRLGFLLPRLTGVADNDLGEADPGPQTF